MPAEIAAGNEPDTKARIVAAGIRCFVRDGIAGASMAAIAEEGRVSKALLHYHFVDRAHLLADVVTVLGRRLVERERSTLARNDTDGPVNTLWRWVSAELDRRELHALLTAATVRNAPVTAALASVARARRDAAGETVGDVFARLGLTPRVHAQGIADTYLIFIDGLALDERKPADARLSFDVFWLAMLSLGE